MPPQSTLPHGSVMGARPAEGNSELNPRSLDSVTMSSCSFLTTCVALASGTTRPTMTVWRLQRWLMREISAWRTTTMAAGAGLATSTTFRKKLVLIDFVPEWRLSLRMLTQFVYRPPPREKRHRLVRFWPIAALSGKTSFLHRIAVMKVSCLRSCEGERCDLVADTAFDFEGIRTGSWCERKKKTVSTLSGCQLLGSLIE